MSVFARHRVLVVSATLVLLGAIVPYLIWGDALEAAFTVQGARTWLAGYGPGAGVAGMGLLVADILLPIPSTLVMSALGLTYGPLVGGLYAAMGSALAGVVAYGLSRWLGRPLALRLAGEAGLREGEHFFVTGGAWVVVCSRCLPILPEAVACLAGLNRMPFRTFLLAVLCGSLPMGFAFAAIGALGQAEPAWALVLSVVVPALLWLGARRWLRR
ncbi:MAG: DedA family protein [Opitutia bacterium]|nr:TVP38/TMEM64 family protein [Opitutales bacterium]PHX79569.1 MAG: DedA family protein [Opitutae bacterium]